VPNGPSTQITQAAFVLVRVHDEYLLPLPEMPEESPHPSACFVADPDHGSKIPGTIGTRDQQNSKSIGPLVQKKPQEGGHCLPRDTSKEVRASLRKDWILRELSCGG